ncbi:hypothetical protein RUM44_011171 [Polyplax serrata]|uniref:Uncharacterized protein n=1 Tax=Polyplax serrata TaxID=468196 RepID=A0ABR1AP95_POLSC
MNKKSVAWSCQATRWRRDLNRKRNGESPIGFRRKDEANENNTASSARLTSFNPLMMGHSEAFPREVKEMPGCEIHQLRSSRFNRKRRRRTTRSSGSNIGIWFLIEKAINTVERPMADLIKVKTTGKRKRRAKC